MQAVTPGDIQFQTVPYVGDDTDSAGRYILRLQDTDVLHDFFAQLSADPQEAATPTTEAPRTVAPADITVDVFNGSGVSGLAASAATALAGLGFRVGTTGNADSMGHEVTEIRHAAGDERSAATLAAAVPGAVPAVSEDVVAGTVQLVLGADFNGVGQAVDVPEPTSPVEGADARTAADTTCIN
jgi:hypothetical protein